MFAFRRKHLSISGTAMLALLTLGAPVLAADRASTILVSPCSAVLTPDPLPATSPSGGSALVYV